MILDESSTYSEQGEVVVTYICPMCDAVGVFCKVESDLDDSNMIH